MGRRTGVTGDVTYDHFLGGAVTVVQPASGYRAGMDAVMLAVSLSAKPDESLIEAGCGAGAALLCAAHRLGDCRLTGIERDEQALALVQQGVAANAMQGRVIIQRHDVAERPGDMENRFDQSFSNPPFFDPASVRAPAPGREAAYLAETSLKAWVLFMHHVTRPGGRITLIHRAAALADLLEVLASRTGEIEVMPIRPAPGAAASRVLVRARKGLRRGPVTLYDGLALHVAPGGPATDRAAEALQGGALEWR
jgi:tRNA1Val (adenine37-N6)-methyltransferase